MCVYYNLHEYQPFDSSAVTTHANCTCSYASVGGAPEAYGSRFVCVCVCVCVSVRRTLTKRQKARC